MSVDVELHGVRRVVCLGMPPDVYSFIVCRLGHVSRCGEVDFKQGCRLGHVPYAYSIIVSRGSAWTRLQTWKTLL